MRSLPTTIVATIAILCVTVAAVDAQRVPLRILTINVWSGLDYQGFFSFGSYEQDDRRELRFQTLVQQIKRLNPDILFVQEANPVGPYTRRLADSLSFDQIHHVCNAGIKFGPFGPPANFKEGISVLAKRTLSLEKVDAWKLSGSFGIYGDLITLHSDETIFALVGMIRVHDRRFYLVNVHLNAAPPRDSLLAQWLADSYTSGALTKTAYEETLQSWENVAERRDLEVRRLLRDLEDLPANSPIILGGDFNSEPGLHAITMIESEGGYSDAYASFQTGGVPTWDPSGNENIRYSTQYVDARGDSLEGLARLSAVYDSRPRRIDYIFLDRHFRLDDVINSSVVLDSVRAGLHVSDHYGLLADIDISSAVHVAPEDPVTIRPSDEHKIEFLPIVSYDTDVGFGYGAKIFALNYLHWNESFDIVLFNSTKGERWYRLAFSMPDFELRQGKIYPWAVDLIIDFDKWISNSFFGLGNSSSFDDRELYTRVPLDMSITASRGFTQHVVAQVGVRYRSVWNSHFAPGSRLETLPPASNSGRASTLSLFSTFRYDTRNSFINPSEGLVLEAEAEVAPKASCSNVAMSRFAGWFQGYTVLFYPKTVLAIRIGMAGVSGDELPVQFLLPIGGNGTVRGSVQDRYLDKVAGVGNLELRFPLFWRFGGVTGVDVGKVWHSFANLNLPRWATNPVLGLRFYMDTFVVRLDVGFGKETTGFYLNFGHVF